MWITLKWKVNNTSDIWWNQIFRIFQLSNNAIWFLKMLMEKLCWKYLKILFHVSRFRYNVTFSAQLIFQQSVNDTVIGKTIKWHIGIGIPKKDTRQEKRSETSGIDHVGNLSTFKQISNAKIDENRQR